LLVWRIGATLESDSERHTAADGWAGISLPASFYLPSQRPKKR
jgi:hypothetical protein